MAFIKSLSLVHALTKPRLRLLKKPLLESPARPHPISPKAFQQNQTLETIPRKLHTSLDPEYF